MKATELRIGNYVDVINRKGELHFPAGVVLQVGSISMAECGLYQSNKPVFAQISQTIESLRNIKPIDLTVEWLERFGYERKPWGLVKGGLLFRDNIKHPCQELTLEVGNGFRVTVRYVHQLQNLCFALTGEELTIKQQDK
jgi:hypothetical protein